MSKPVGVIIEALKLAEAIRSANVGGPPIHSPEWAMIRANTIVSALEEAGLEIVPARQAGFIPRLPCGHLQDDCPCPGPQ